MKTGLLVLLAVLGCHESFGITVERQCGPPRVSSALVEGTVTAADGTPAAGAPVLVTWRHTASVFDTAGACTPIQIVDTSVTSDSQGQFKAKFSEAIGSFVCARASAFVGGAIGESELVKLVLLTDLGPGCTSDSDLMTGRLDIVLPP